MRHFMVVACLLPRPRAWRAWNLVRRSSLWTKYFDWKGTVPGGRCLLRVLKLNSQAINDIAEARRDWEKWEIKGEGLLRKLERERRDSTLRDMDRRLEAYKAGLPIWEVHFFLNTVGRIDEHPWHYRASVDVDSGQIIVCVNTLITQT
jgi:hypothetical protein